MEHFQKVFSHIKRNKLPIKYKTDGNFLYVDCSGWDITEMDTFCALTNGKRNEFIIVVEQKGENDELK